VGRLGAPPSQLLPTIANYRKLSQLFAAPLAPPGLCTPRSCAGMSLGDAAIRLQPSCAAWEHVGAAPYRTGTPRRARLTGRRMLYVHPGRQGCQGHLCGIEGSDAGALAWTRRAGKVARLGAPPSQLLPTIAKYRKLSQLFAAPLAPPGLCTPRSCAGMSLGDAAIRLQPSCAAWEHVGAAPYRTGTPCRARLTGRRMSYVHPGRQGCQGRLCGV